MFAGRRMIPAGYNPSWFEVAGAVLLALLFLPYMIVRAWWRGEA